jgi:hypothetical protein
MNKTKVIRKPKKIQNIGGRKVRIRDLSKLDNYVYGLYKKGKVNPYYIGQGKRERCLWAFKSEDPPDKVIIYISGLTTEGSMLVESVLIDFCKYHDFELDNINDGWKKIGAVPFFHRFQRQDYEGR